MKFRISDVKYFDNDEIFLFSSLKGFQWSDQMNKEGVVKYHNDLNLFWVYFIVILKNDALPKLKCITLVFTY